MKTNYQLPVSELNQAGTFFANLGLECPWVGPDAWCDLLEERIQCCTHWGWVDCPPAVAAAVVWFALQVRRWDFERTRKVYSDMRHTHMTVLPHPPVRDVPETVEEAAALILGVYKAMGGE